MLCIKIVSDIDGTVADVMSVACARVRDQWGIPFTPEDVCQPDFSEAVHAKFPEVSLTDIRHTTDSWWKDPALYEDLTPYTDMLEQLIVRLEFARILFVSARPATEELYQVTVKWLQAQKLKKFRVALGVSALTRVELCQRIQPDEYYDDLPANVRDVFRSCPYTSAILVPRPWNGEGLGVDENALFRFTSAG